MDIYHLQLLLTRVKIPEELTEHNEKLLLDLLKKHKVGEPLERSMGLGGAG